ncbi:hypothetical protein Taro_039530 [Colocasia esculenta]|uniref:Hydrophobic seed protein domain-containing protein n=1 Tax=Colocasia esculenta TaxID=4460 RepID=A0A843WAW3_COLES|nr:hypothetical protein [Colocasia esculenta]
MESSKLSALLLICMLFLSTTSPIFACGTCAPPRKPKRPKHNPPVVVPPIIKPPPVVVPPVIKPPPVVAPPITVPPVVPILPPVVPILPPVVPILPPVIPILPPVVNPPVVKPPVVIPCPPPPAPLTCPVDTLKIGACVDLLGGLLNVKIGDPAANHCCPILGGLLELEAAVCLSSSSTWTSTSPSPSNCWPLAGRPPLPATAAKLIKLTKNLGA